MTKSEIIKEFGPFNSYEKINTLLDYLVSSKRPLIKPLKWKLEKHVSENLKEYFSNEYDLRAKLYKSNIKEEIKKESYFKKGCNYIERNFPNSHKAIDIKNFFSKCPSKWTEELFSFLRSYMNENCNSISLKTHIVEEMNLIREKNRKASKSTPKRKKNIGSGWLKIIYTPMRG